MGIWICGDNSFVLNFMYICAIEYYSSIKNMIRHILIVDYSKLILKMIQILTLVKEGEYIYNVKRYCQNYVSPTSFKGCHI